MSYTALRIFDEKRNRTICASPTVFTVWEGRDTSGRMIAGPTMLAKTHVPHSTEDLEELYDGWRDAGEPGTNLDRARTTPEARRNLDAPQSWEPQDRDDIYPER